MSVRHWFAVVIASVMVVVTAGCGDDTDSGADLSADTGLGSHKVTEVATRGTVTPDDTINGPGSGQPDEAISDDDVVGGVEAKIGQYPWTVALVIDGDSDNFCGGVLLSPTLVLTAAHCTRYQKEDADGEPVGEPVIIGPDLINVVAGRLRLSDSGGQVVGVSRVEQFADYDPRSHRTDYAYLYLDGPINQKAISIPSSGATDLWELDGDVLVAGWGCQISMTKPTEACENAGNSPLESTQLQVVDGARCGSGFDSETGLCMVSQPDTTPCNGDSGGPFVAQGDDGNWYVVAVVSYGTKGCPAGQPVVGSFVKYLVDGSGKLLPHDVIACPQGNKVCGYPS